MKQLQLYDCFYCLGLNENEFKGSVLDTASTLTYKKGQLSLTNPRDAFEKFARFT